MKFVPGAVSSAALIMLAACGGGDGGGSSSSPAPTATASPSPSPRPTPSPTPTPSPIPARTSTLEYPLAFTPSEDRSFGGFRLSVTNSLTGETLPNGSAQISSVVALQEKSGPRSSDGIGFSGNFGFEVGTGEGTYLDRANNSIRFNASASFLETQTNFLRWALPMDTANPKPRSLTWSMANAFGGQAPEFYSAVMLDRPNASQERFTYIFFGGSPTEEEDLPQSGQETQAARLLLESDEPGDGSYLLVAEGPLTIDYDRGNVMGSFDLQPGNDWLAGPMTLDVDADFNLEFVSFSMPVGQILGDVTSTSGRGRIGGAFFGPYASEIAISVAFETSDGQSFYGDLEARRQ